MTSNLVSKEISAEEAAELIQDGEVLGVSGFTLAGYPKAVPTALAKRAERLHAQGKSFQITLFSGASITRVPSVRPLMILFLWGNAWA